MAMHRALYFIAAAFVYFGGAQAQRWENPEGTGNVRIAAQDETFNWGTTLPSEALNRIKEHCSNVGCHSGDKLYVDTTIISVNSKFDRQLELSIQGSFSENDEIGSLEDLVEIAKEVVKGNHELKHLSYFPLIGCHTSNLGCLRKLH
jgi:hypothetical protein